MYKSRIHTKDMPLDQFKCLLGELTYMLNSADDPITFLVLESGAILDIVMIHRNRIDNEQIAEITDCFDYWEGKVEEKFFNAHTEIKTT